MIALPRPHRLSRAEYERLVELGEFKDRRAELIRGQIVDSSPPGIRHAWVITKLNMLLTPELKGHALVQMQCPLAVSDESQPEPDLAVLELDDYGQKRPTTALLVIEVADSSLAADRRDKAALYAECGILRPTKLPMLEMAVGDIV